MKRHPLGGARQRDARAEAKVLLPRAGAGGMLRRPRGGPVGTGDVCSNAGRPHTRTHTHLQYARWRLPGAPGHGMVWYGVVVGSGWAGRDAVRRCGGLGAYEDARCEAGAGAGAGAVSRSRSRVVLPASALSGAEQRRGRAEQCRCNAGQGQAQRFVTCSGQGG
ncbi:hypothetical protein P171DRAFT_153249 [Karstenula rhodostoma CBS 690.94]|uniref:Uncharacterized protein n=1 Tax=Karstenula rhodostoma CBS 690.94 TaxID=1392251 RepID=A0A9P4PTM2_9PLEO|nr:hypothetical protein P171DRAFT_153249 [Karstenula rhodostoma CBS 690.94]